MCFGEKMCVRLVFVLVLCCVQSWAQQDPILSRGVQENAENPSVPPQVAKYDPADDLILYQDAPKHKVKLAGAPGNLKVFVLPLENSNHELQFNVSWLPSSGTGVPATGYSVEVMSVTETDDCVSQICYRTNIPENATWVLIPENWNTVLGGCAIRPGCAYLVKVAADPWDGYTTANLTKELDECEAGICSCAHSPRLPKPQVSAQIITMKGEIYSNVSWTLPTPSEPQRLPAKLGKQSYIVTLMEQIPSSTNTSPWFARVANRTRHVDTNGLVFEGDTPRWIRLPISLDMALKVKLLAKVKLVDNRGCFGPAGNATVFAPAEVSKSKLSFGIYAILGAVIGGLALGAVIVLSARVVKRVLMSSRPAPISAPLEPLIKGDGLRGTVI